ncbi:MAG TPA: C40 family peptidase [bacterium]|nr:C40 family peptidase [bacterium]
MTKRGGAFALLLGLCAAPHTGAAQAAAAPAAITSDAGAGRAVWDTAPPRVAVPAPLPSRGAAFASRIARQALAYLGRPYRWSGLGGRGFDCSGLVVRVFGALGVSVPHSSSGQYQAGRAVPAASLGPGDLVFFRTYTSGPSHVGIYLGARRFIHASVSRGVIVSSMDDPYYRRRFLGARRY